MNILGIWDGHDSGAALLCDGRLVAAVNEERLTRRKLEIRFPVNAIGACLHLAGIKAVDVDRVAISTTDIAKTLARWFPATKETYYAVRRRQATPGRMATVKKQAKYWLTEWPPNRISRVLSRAALRRELRGVGLGNARLRMFDHHACHGIAAACFSPVHPCAVLTIDGVGDGLSTTISAFREDKLRRLVTSPARHSLGVFFEYVTTLLNMRELEDEGKVMALADFASPVADEANPLLSLIDVREGRIHIALRGRALVSRLKQVLWRYPNEQFAFMAQRTVEHVCMRLAQDAVRMTGIRHLAVAGGVASNINATRRMRLLPEVDGLYVFPHMGDGGLALGAALAAARESGQSVRNEMQDLALGPEYSSHDMSAALEEAGLDSEQPSDVAVRVADLIAQGRIVLWFQGRMEYGPRALGQRSVLARPDRTSLRDRLNLVLKRRVWYQPFCPSVLESEAAQLFSDWTGPSNRVMTMAYQVDPKFRTALAGVTAPDGSCRPQIVPDGDDQIFAVLLRLVKQRLGVGVVLNTSYNVHGEPLVCTPGEAVDVFMRSGADALALGPFLTTRSKNLTT